ncbi:helix-turn-helix domain-containing protein [Marinobacter halotolerans]|uniref:helix-turn-helix domain-containing protein n=1 Tax=Marinobacter halotolerans TaxID=1569211 RepID=UPI00124917E5|nr:helix-turn-helix transcriptional regulator [Marinobacter halotolerans]
MSLGQALRQLRKQKGFTLAELAQRTDSYVGNLSRIERDISRPSLDLLYRISESLNFSLAEVFSISELDNRAQNPDQIALNTIFISLLEKDRDLLVAFAKLLRERAGSSPEEIMIESGHIPSESREEIDSESKRSWK